MCARAGDWASRLGEPRDLNVIVNQVTDCILRFSMGQVRMLPE